MRSALAGKLVFGTQVSSMLILVRLLSWLTPEAYYRLNSFLSEDPREECTLVIDLAPPLLNLDC